MAVDSRGATRVLIVEGSPRAGGATARAASILAGELAAALEARGLGAEVGIIRLREKVILPCRGCRLCFDSGEDRCPLEDDLAAIAAEVLRAELLVLATPVYVNDMSGLMKTWIDRMAWLCHRPALAGQLGFSLLTAGSSHSPAAAGNLAFALGTWASAPVGSLSLLAGATLAPGAEEAFRPRIRRAARRLARDLHRGRASKPGLRALLVFKVQQLAWSREPADSLDRRWWRERGLLEPGRTWHRAHRSNPALVALARAAGSLVARIVLRSAP